MNVFNRTLTRYLISLLPLPAFALEGVHPTGVNVRTTGPSTVFLTFRGTENQTSTQAMWCGDITVAANTVTSFNPCVPGTLLGRLPKRLDQSRNSGTQGQVNTTDIMTIPASVSRKALQAARRGEKSSFFYVRKFEGTGGTQYVAVTCRLAGGGARVPLAIMHVTPAFNTDRGKQPVELIAQGDIIPGISAALYYNGSGRLKGRWELVRPGDPQPTDFDLLPEASLPVEQRGLQKRYQVLSRFDINLPPTGKVTVPGPDTDRLPNTQIGEYQVLLRVEATRDKEGNSNTGSGTAFTGGVAGFSLPPLKYYVGVKEDVTLAKVKAGLSDIKQITLLKAEAFESGKAHFKWLPAHMAQTVSHYLFKLFRDDELIHQAVVNQATAEYTPPPWLIADDPEATFEWQVEALSRETQLAISPREHLVVNE